jgi:lysophospholipase L1-like esterase
VVDDTTMLALRQALVHPQSPATPPATKGWRNGRLRGYAARTDTRGDKTMADRERAQIIDPSAAMSDGERGPFPFDLYERSCLAQGDSWFSMGAIPPTRTTRVLAELKLLRSTVIVNCAYPGAVLHRMTNTVREQNFLNLLGGRRSRRFDVILLSGGGNDLIDAIGSPPGSDPAQRLLRTPAERGAGPLAPADYISSAGWQTFTDHIGTVVADLVSLRDGSKFNAQTPIVWHNYARVMPRPSPAGLGFGPWLLPALQRYEVPAADHLAVADELLARLRRLIDDLVAAQTTKNPAARLFVADSMSAGLVLSDPTASGDSGDWLNEIHPNRAGYQKCAMAWQAVLDPLLD